MSKPTTKVQSGFKFVKIPKKRVPLPDHQLTRNEHQLQAMLIQAQSDYIKVLQDELDDVVPFAAPHGWQSNRYLVGLALRANIENMLDLLPPSNQAKP